MGRDKKRKSINFNWNWAQGYDMLSTDPKLRSQWKTTRVFQESIRERGNQNKTSKQTKKQNEFSQEKTLIKFRLVSWWHQVHKPRGIQQIFLSWRNYTVNLQTHIENIVWNNALYLHTAYIQHIISSTLTENYFLVLINEKGCKR